MSARLLQINYAFHGTREEFEQGFAPVAAEIAQVPGLRWKIWLFDDAQSRGGGIYVFDDQASLDAYVAGPVIAALRTHPAFENLSIQSFDVLAEPTRRTRGPL